MTSYGATQFRAACYSADGSVQHKDFDTEVSANAWAAKNIKDFDKLVVEKYAAGEWGPGATFSHR
jgi:hypothetical protein